VCSSDLWPAFSGLILLEAVKQTFAVKPRGRRAPARVFVPGVLAPQPVRRALKDSGAGGDRPNKAWTLTAKGLA
jgi:hypothetical protein